MTTVVRSLTSHIKKDLKKKIVLLAGPRQSGKTTLSRDLVASFDYLNFDSPRDKKAILNQEWDRSKKLIILDEVHKMPKWKSWIKGVYDTEGVNPNLLITGSAKLNTYRKFGDSLAGRHFYYRLHPFDIMELQKASYSLSPDEVFRKLMSAGGYPEPFLSDSPDDYFRWRKSHTDLIIRQDLLDIENVRDVQGIELLLQLLRTRVGSPISANSLAKDLQKDQKTVQKWLLLLEEVFLIFRVTPYSKNIERAVKKEPKFYFYDVAFVEGTEAQKFENLVACALLKECHFQADTTGHELRLHYLKVRGGRELDFVTIPEEKHEPVTMVEAKWAETDASPNFKLFSGHFKKPRQVQLVAEIKRNFSTSSGIEITKASEWLADFSLR